MSWKSKIIDYKYNGIRNGGSINVLYMYIFFIVKNVNVT